MRSSSRLFLSTAFTLLLAMLSACGGGGGGGSTPPPPPPPPPPVTPLSVTTVQIPTGVVGKAYSTTLQATGGSGTRTWSLVQGPSWLSINSSTGELTGTATDVWFGSIDVAVRDSSGHAADTWLLLMMYSVLQIVSPAGGTLGLDYSGAITTTGGYQPANKLSVTGSLPPGLTVQLDDFGNGNITGTPTQAGSFTFTVEATDRATPPQDVKADVTMVIDTHIGITTKQLKSGVQGRPYSDTATLVNGTAPFTWSAQSLPNGLSIDSATGEITGTPQLPWGISPTLTVIDSSSPPQTAHRTVNLQIYGVLKFGDYNPVFTSNAGSFWQSISAYGGVPPITYSITSGQLPAGLSLGTIGGYISGTIQQGDYEFTLAVQDSASPPQVVERPFALHILPPRVFVSSGGTLQGFVGKAFASQFVASAGTPPYTWRTTGPLPPGVTLSDSGLLSGTPSTDGYYEFNAEVSDSANPAQKASSYVTFQVMPTSPAPNNTIANAAPLPISGVVATISPYTDDNGVAAPDTDYFRFLAQGGSTVSVGASVWGLATYLDPVLELLDQNGTRLKTCNNPADDNPPSFIVKDLTPNGFDDDCVNDDSGDGSLGSALVLKVPGNSDTIQTVYAHVVDYRGDARPDMSYRMEVYGAMEAMRLHRTPVGIGAVGNYFSWWPSVTGGLGTHTVSLGSGSTLPPGLSFSANGISGFPTDAGQYAVSLLAQDSANPPETEQGAFQFTIVPKLTINGNSLPDGTVGAPYDAKITTSGGGQSLHFSIYGTSWPCCLYLQDDGHITGTPKESGTFQPWIFVQDESDQLTSMAFTLNVSSGTLQMKTFTLPTARTGSTYNAVIVATGGKGPYTWRVVEGSLPPGITLNGAELHGQATRPGTYPFTVEAREVSGQVAKIGLAITVR
jgi:hypothetical protein